MEFVQRTPCGNPDGRGCHRDIVRSLPQTVGVVIAERIPETVQLAPDSFDILRGGPSPSSDGREATARVTYSSAAERVAV
jgi:hypothetical protein